jgi:hypothetical protein
MRKNKVSEWDVQTQLGHKRPGVTELSTAFDPAYLKDAAKALDKLVRAACVRMPTREVRTFRRNGKDLERDGWWAHKGSNLGPLPCEGNALPLSYAPGILVYNQRPEAASDRTARQKQRFTKCGLSVSSGAAGVIGAFAPKR